MLAGGHEIARLFFYQTGYTVPRPTWSRPRMKWMAAQWRAFIETHQLDAVVCIAAALRRGVLDEAEPTAISARP